MNISSRKVSVGKNVVPKKVNCREIRSRSIAGLPLIRTIGRRTNNRISAHPTTIRHQ
jgi:hypothetical protein